MSKPPLFSNPKLPGVTGFPKTGNDRVRPLVYAPGTKTGAQSWLSKTQGQFTSVSGGFQLSKNDLPNIFHTQQQGRLGKPIGLSIFDDFSFLVWRDMGRHIYLAALSYQMGRNPERIHQLMMEAGQDFRQNGPNLFKLAQNAQVPSHIFNCEAIKDPYKRRWAFTIKNGLVESAESILNSLAKGPKPWIEKYEAPRGGCALVPGMNYGFNTKAFEEKSSNWFQSAVLKNLTATNQDEEAAIEVIGGGLAWDNSYAPPRITYLTIPGGTHKQKEKIRDAYERTLKKHTFGDWWESFNTGTENRYNNPHDVVKTSFIPSQLSAHQKMAAIARTL